MRTACYLRYSSDMQRAASITDQLRNVENYCARMNLPMPTIFKDEAFTGSRNDRPGYQAMLAAARNKEFDILLVDDLDRMSRDSIETATIIRQLKYIGTQIIGVSDGIDTSRDGYKIETTLRGLMGELYLDELAKKTHRGLMGQALKGYSAGKVPYGYTSIHDGQGFKPVINEEQAQWVRYIFERYSNGISSRQIAFELNEKCVPGPHGPWMHTTIHPSPNLLGMIGNPIYIGKRMWNRTSWKKDPMTGKPKRRIRPREEWVVVESPETRIVDEETWRKCELLIDQQKAETGKQKEQGKWSGGARPKYLFSGLLKCGVCGAQFTVISHTKYGCYNHKNKGDTVCNNKLLIKRDTLEQELLAGIKNELLSEEAYRDFEKNLRASIKSGHGDSSPIKKKITDLQKKVDNLIKAISDGINSPSVKAALQDHEQQLQGAQNELKAFERIQPAQMVPRAREMYETLVASLETIEDVETARQALRQLVGEIILSPENGSLTAEVAATGLSFALQITSNVRAGFERYLQPARRFSGLK